MAESHSPSSSTGSRCPRAALATFLLLVAGVLLASLGPYSASTTRGTTFDVSPSAPPSSSRSSSSINAADSLDMPVIPLSSQRARSKMWRRVTATVDVDQSNSIIAEHRRVCADPSSSVRFEDRDPKESLAAKVQAVAFGFGKQNQREGRRVGFRRIFVALVLTSKRNRPRICSNGAVIEAALESQQDMVDVDFMLEVAPGLYELQPFFRRSGRYSLCMAVAKLNPRNKLRFTPDLLMGAAGAVEDTIKAEKVWFCDQTCPNTCVAQKWESQRQCFDEDVQLAADSVSALQQRLKKLRGGRRCGAKPGEPGSRQDFRSGAWTRLLQCDGDQCTGDPTKALPSVSEEQKQSDIAAGGMWVFVSDTCTVKLYSRREAWRVVDAQWILNWGGSTLKQPAANFLEYTLGVPVFSVFMENLEAIRNIKHRPGFFSYRQFDVHKTWIDPDDGASSEKKPLRQLRSTLCWGGCPNPYTPSQTCGMSMGMHNRDCTRAALSQTGPAYKPPPRPPVGGFSSSNIPSVIFVSHFWWRSGDPLINESAYMEQLDETVRWLTAAVAERMTNLVAANNSSSGCVKKPLLVWVGNVRRVYAEDTSNFCTLVNQRALERRLAWRVEQFFSDLRSASSSPSSSSSCFSASSSSPFRDQIHLSRTELTSPLHAGSRFGHNAVHYGATKGMCLTAGARSRKYMLDACLRNTTGDWMLMQWWLNAMDDLL